MEGQGEKMERKIEGVPGETLGRMWEEAQGEFLEHTGRVYMALRAEAGRGMQVLLPPEGVRGELLGNMWEEQGEFLERTE